MTQRNTAWAHGHVSWARAEIAISTEDGKISVLGYRPSATAQLAVTPQTAERAGLNRFVITHISSGLRLWPNDWPLEEAKQVCLELLALGDWEYPGHFRSEAEAIVRQHIDPVSSPGSTAVQ